MSTVDKYVGKLLDKRYHLTRVLGIGGMAVVFEAQDIVMNRKVAVKMLKDEIANDEQSVQRFINESRAVSMLSHPNIVKIFDVSVKGNLKYIVMERVEGITLKSYMQRKGALSTDEVLSYSEQLLKALEHAHSKGIIHRDIKPQNVMLLKNGKVKVTDFGIAKLEGRDSGDDKAKAIGTVYYISPEQASGKEIDPRSDLYSAGVVMYEMATGSLPFNADTPVSVAMKQVTDKPQAPSEIRPDIPVGLEQIILGAMEKNPERRFQSATQMLKYVGKLRTFPDYIFKTRKERYNEVSASTGIEAIDNEMKKRRRKTKRPQSNSMFPIILGVTVAFGIVIITGAISLLDMILKTENVNTPITVEVPGVVGDVYDQAAIKELFDPSIYKVVIETKYDATHPENTVIKQEPEEGEKRKVLKNRQYCEVVLTISKGAEKLFVPDYTGYDDYREVKIAANELGFKVVEIAVESEIFKVNQVMYTVPAAKTEVEYGSTLTVYWSKGASAKRVEVPKLTNLQPKAAYAKMNGNLKVGEVSYEYSDTVAEGLIISQSLASGTTVVKGSAINFVISLGPAPVTEPPTTEPPVTDPPTTDDTDTEPSDTDSTQTTEGSGEGQNPAEADAGGDSGSENDPA